MRKILFITAVLATSGYGVYRWQTSESNETSTARPAAEHDDELVVNRLWIDHIPRNDKDTFQIFALLEDESMGIFQATSTWRGSYELFKYEAHGNDLRFVFPQTGEREQVRARATECDKNGMDYCLELHGSKHGAKRYFSMEGWEIGSRFDIDAKAAQIAH